MQRVMIIIASLVAAAAVAVVAAPPAQGVSQSQLENAGWICFKPVPTDNLHCVRPGGLERVLTGEAETMSFLVFRATDGAFLGTELIVRADIFNGQPCPTDPPGRQYTYLMPLLGLDYYACHRYDSSF